MDFNDTAQWVVLIVQTIFLVGLTRQLAFFLRPNEQRRAEAIGPRVGDKVSSELFEPSELEQVKALLHDNGRAGMALLVVHELCDPCESWLERLATASRRAVPVVAFTKHPTHSYRQRVAQVADLVLEDDDRDRLKEAGMIGSPYALLLDSNFRVMKKQLGGDPSELLGLSESAEGDPNPASDLSLSVMNTKGPTS